MDVKLEQIGNGLIEVVLDFEVVTGDSDHAAHRANGIGGAHFDITKGGRCSGSEAIITRWAEPDVRFVPLIPVVFDDPMCIILVPNPIPYWVLNFDSFRLHSSAAPGIDVRARDQAGG